MTKDKALRLALEALEFDGFTPEDATHRIFTTKAIAAINEALAQPVPDLTEQQRELYQKGHNDGVAHHKQAVKAAQPEQDLIPKDDLFVCGQMGAHVTRVYAQPEQEENTKQRVLQLIKELRPAIRPMEALGKPMTTQEWFDVLVKNIEVMI